LATMGHDGLARAVVPAHTATDGDVVFGLSTAARPIPDLPGLVAVHTAAADVVSRAIVHALLAADGVTTPARTWRSYREIVGL
jgi:L-aminopeptidase/D-esterase-like protein